MRSDRKGLFYAFLAYFLWGLFPLYWKQLDGIPATQLIGHRIIWSFIFLVALFALRGQLAHLRTLLHQQRTSGRSTLATLSKPAWATSSIRC